MPKAGDSEQLEVFDSLRNFGEGFDALEDDFFCKLMGDEKGVIRKKSI